MHLLFIFIINQFQIRQNVFNQTPIQQFNAIKQERKFQLINYIGHIKNFITYLNTFDIILLHRFMKKNPDEKQYASSLGLTIQQLSDFGKIRKAYKIQMRNVLRNRSERIKLNRAYSEVCANLFKSNLSTLERSIITGDLESLNKELSKNKKLLNAKVNQYPIIYLAVRSGHYDIVQYLLKSGCSLNFKDCKSTPMHCAAYYGHYNIIPLLLMYGVPVDIKNQFDSLPIEEAANPLIERLLTVVKQNRIKLLNQMLLNKQIGHSVINIQLNKKIVCKKIIVKNYFKYYNSWFYNDAFHGTSYDNLASIMQYGLQKPGDIVNGKKIDIVPGHIPLGSQFQGKKNWSKAIFLSPSIYYAAHPVYSKQFIENSENSSWLPLVQTKVKAGSYSKHDHTLNFYDPKCEEPTDLQFRVQCADPQKDLIFRSQSSQNVIVIAAIFILKGFLQQNSDYKAVTNLILDSGEQKMFRKLNA